jgi:flagellar protein FliO/FliZ
MSSVIWWFVAMAMLAAVVAVVAILVKAYISGETPAQVFFKPRPEPRLSVIEHASIDGKRKLVLVRRDDVEHLIMTGGPVDVVIETGIETNERLEKPRSADSYREPAAGPNPPVFSRAPRTFGQAQSEQQTAIDEMEAALKR